MTELRGLVREDGAVIVPAGMAAEVLRYLKLAMTLEARSNGVVASPRALRLLDAMYAAAQREADQVDLDDTPSAGACSVTEAADYIGCHPSYVRRLLAQGRLAGRRSGGVWLVDLPVAMSLPRQRAA